MFYAAGVGHSLRSRHCTKHDVCTACNPTSRAHPKASRSYSCGRAKTRFQTRMQLSPMFINAIQADSMHRNIEFIHILLFRDAMQSIVFPLWSQALTKEFWKSETDGWIHLLTRGGFFSEQQEETIQPYNNSWWLLSYQTRRNQNHTIAHKEPLSDQSLWWMCCLVPAP